MIVEDLVSARFCGVFAGVGSISFLVPMEEWKPWGELARLAVWKEVLSSPKCLGLFARLREIVEGGVMLEDPETLRFAAD